VALSGQVEDGGTTELVGKECKEDAGRRTKGQQMPHVYPQ
jgi:hypothetical protein